MGGDGGLDGGGRDGGGRTGFSVGEVRARGGDQVRERGFQRVVGAQHVDVDDGFEGVGADLGDWGEEVAGGAGAEPR